MNYLKYIRNMIKAKHVLVKQYDDLSKLTSELHIQLAAQTSELKTYKENKDAYIQQFDKYLRDIEQKDELIQRLEEQNKKDNQQILIHANEKRSLIALLRTKQSEIK